MNAHKAIDTPKNRVRVWQRRLYRSAKACPGRRYANLYDKVYREDILAEAWRRVARNGGACGVDGVSIEWVREYGVDAFLAVLRELLRSGAYSPANIRRVYISKTDGGERPLGIPTLCDRVVQMAVKLVIEPLYEADFLPCSYGFRPRRSSHQAIHEIDDHLRRGYRAVVDVDLKQCFDTIPHERLLELVQQRVTDRHIVRLIRYWLQAGIEENGTVSYPELGSPQGGVLSPLLANIYLHEIDRIWAERAPRAVLIRYADDMLILCPSLADAEREYAHLQTVVTELGLTLNTAKTRVGATREGFDFLGFSFRRGVYTRGGKRREIIIKVPRSKAEQAMRRKLKEQIQYLHLGDPLDETVQRINRRLRGWVQYFRISNLRDAVDGLIYYTCEQLRLSLRRRYNRKRSQYTRRWPDALFHETYGLYTSANLLNGR